MEEALEVTTAPGDIWRASVAADRGGRLWVFWSQRDGAKWDLWGRLLTGGSWDPPQKISVGRYEHVPSGRRVPRREGLRGLAECARRPDRYLHARLGRSVDGPRCGSAIPAPTTGSRRLPVVQTARPMSLWDGYHDGNYDIFYRSFANGSLGEIEQVTRSPRFQAHANVAVAPDGDALARLGRVRHELGQGSRVLDHAPALGSPASGTVHSGRAEIRRGNGPRPRPSWSPSTSTALYPNFENPQLAFDSGGTLTMLVPALDTPSVPTVSAPA